MIIDTFGKQLLKKENKTIDDISGSHQMTQLSARIAAPVLTNILPSVTTEAFVGTYVHSLVFHIVTSF